MKFLALNNKNPQNIIAVVVIGFFIFLSAYALIKRVTIENKGVFVLGQVYKTSIGKSGKSYHCYYYFKGQKYEGVFTGTRVLGRYIGEGDMVFFKIKPNGPSNYVPEYEVEVPTCLSLKDVPVEGWEKVPKDACK